MKFAVDRQVLARALATASRIVEKRTTIPILSHCLIVAEPGRLRVVASDLDIEATITAPAAVERPGSVALPAHLLAGIVSKLTASTLTVDLAEGAPTVAIVAGRSRFALPWLPAEDYPSLSVGELPCRFELQSADLRRILDDVAFAISTEESRYYLNGAYMHPLDGKLVAVATDGHRLARSVMPLPAGADDFPPALVPRKTVAEILKAVAGETKPTSVAVSDAKIRIEIGELVLLSKLIDGVYPDYSRVIPADQPIAVTVDRAELAAAIDLVSTVRAEKTSRLKMEIGEGRILLDMFDPTGGSAASEEVNAELSGDPIVIGVNARYLADAVESFDAEIVTIHMTDPTLAMRIVDPKRDDLAVVVMPMRV